MQSGQSDWHRPVSDPGSVERIGQQRRLERKTDRVEVQKRYRDLCLKMRSCREVPR